MAAQDVQTATGAFDRAEAALRKAGVTLEATGEGLRGACPVCGDANALVLRKDDKGLVPLECSCWCSGSEIAEKLGLAVEDVMTTEQATAKPPAATATATANGKQAAAIVPLKRDGLNDEELAALQRYVEERAQALYEDTPSAKEAFEYAERRWGVTPELAKKIRLGFDPGGANIERPAFLNHFQFSARIIVPLLDREGTVRSLQGRSLDPKDSRRWMGPGGSGLPYVGCFGLQGTDGPIVITEGPGDALSVFAAGQPVIWVPGASYTSPSIVDDIEELAARPADSLNTDEEPADATRPLVIAGDKDEAGQNFCRKLGGALHAHYLADRPDDCKDLTEWREADPEAFPGALGRAVSAALGDEPLRPPSEVVVPIRNSRIGHIDDNEYFEIGPEGTFHVKRVPSKDMLSGYEERRTLLAWFAPLVQADVYRDEGFDIVTDESGRVTRITHIDHVARVQIEFGGKTKVVDIPDSELERVTSWARKAMGSGAATNALVNSVDKKVLTAMQVCSGEEESVPFSGLRREIPRIDTYCHTGWRKIGGRWLFLHSGGVIGAQGLVEDVSVSLSEQHANFELPAPLTGQELQDAIAEQLTLINMGPDEVIIPILATVFVAVLGAPAEWSVGLVGPSGAGKTTLAALAQQHFGGGLDSSHLPAAWRDTNVALEITMALSRDVVMVIDDFVVKGSRSQQESLDARADTVLRGAANGSGRARGTADGGVKAARRPGCVVIWTGESLPSGTSLQARILIVPMKRGDGVPSVADKRRQAILTHAQHSAAEGVFAGSTAAWIQSMADNYEVWRKLFKKTSEAATDRWRQDPRMPHQRSPKILGDVEAAVEMWLDWTVAVGVLEAPDKALYMNRVRRALGVIATNQQRASLDERTDRRFLTLLRSALATKSAFLRDADTEGKPDESLGWGWLPDGSTKPGAQQIGWLKRVKTQTAEQRYNIWLDLTATLGVLNTISQAEGRPFAVPSSTVQELLQEHGWLLTPAGNGYTEQHRIGDRAQNRRVRVLVLSAEQFREMDGAADDDED